RLRMAAEARIKELEEAALKSEDIPDTLSSGIRELEAARIVASVPAMSVASDTVVFQTSSLLLSPEADLGDLLSSIPGMIVEDDGTLTIDGKPVREVLIQGKRFFGEDVAGSLKHLPADMVSRILCYNRPSERSRISGIDNGDEETVIDIDIKPRYLENWHTRTDAGGGSHGRYAGNFSANRMGESSKLTLAAEATNISPIPDISRTGKSFGTGKKGETAIGEAGINYASDRNGRHFSGHISYKGSDKDAYFDQYNEYVRASGEHTSLATGREQLRTHLLTAEGMIEADLRKDMTFYAKPTLTFLGKQGENSLDTKTYFSSPTPLLRSERSTPDRNRNFLTSLEAQLTRRCEKRGRSWSLFLEGGYQQENDDLSSFSLIHYPPSRRRPVDTLVRRDRACESLTATASLGGQLMWIEPLAENHFLQFSLRHRFRRTDSDKDNWILEDGARTYDEAYSAAGRYDLQATYLTFNYRYTRNKTRLTAGATLVRIHTGLSFPETWRDNDTTTRLLRIVPNLNFTRSGKDFGTIRAQFRSFVTPPAIENLLPVAANANPLYIRMPNTGLRPSLTLRSQLSWILSDKDSRKSLSMTFSREAVKDALSISTRYNADEGGGRIITPVNIDGNWKADADIVGRLAFAKGKFVLNNHLAGSLSEERSYLYNNSTREDDMNRSTRLYGRDDMTLIYRTGPLETRILGGVEISDERNALRPAMNQYPIIFRTGGSVLWKTPWKSFLSSDLRWISQNGFGLEDLNRSYWIWNAKISHGFLKDRLILQAEARDILGQYENLVRNFTAERRLISRYDGTASYALLKLIWNIR
ncbi:MAG: outer membrane beta-barrel protein, partial [Bacteroidales bacterium]|nr:outer membrane beta-barrel protein [Bacteroidales bacterium]